MRFACVLIVALTMFSYASAGVVRTLDGKTFDGAVSFDQQGFLLVSNKNGPDAHIDPATLLDADFVDQDSAAKLRSGLVLVDGTVIAAEEISRADDTTLEFRHQSVLDKIPLSRVAKIIFRPILKSQLAKVPAGHFGALLDTGDLFEGEFRGINGTSVTVESVLFGISNFSTFNQILALVLVDPQPISGNWVVQFANGSEFAEPALKFAGGKLQLLDWAGRAISVDAKEIAEIRYGPGRMDALNDIKPAAIQPMAPESYVLNATSCGVPMALRGYVPSEGICIGAGASVSYPLDGKYRIFSAKIGVPLALAPFAHVQFVVLADRKEVYRSPGRTSFTDAGTVVVNLSGVKNLVLKVESAESGDLGAVGLWADAALIRAGQ